MILTLSIGYNPNGPDKVESCSVAAADGIGPMRWSNGLRDAADRIALYALCATVDKVHVREKENVREYRVPERIAESDGWGPLGPLGKTR